ncbi:hypothetical protein ACFCYC_02465 [Streptomyces sp. NPDC056402]
MTTTSGWWATAAPITVMPGRSPRSGAISSDELLVVHDQHRYRAGG